MAILVNAKNAMLNTFKPLAGYASLHTGPVPSTANEIPATGGSPNYARKAVVYGTIANGAVPFSAITFDVPPGTTIGSVAFCASGVRGTDDFALIYDVIPDETYGGQGNFVVNAGTVDLNVVA